jgi:quercetin dioxygenase-like cupin family protein
MMRRLGFLVLVVAAVAAVPAIASFRAAPAPSRVVLGAATAFGTHGKVLGLTSITIPAGAVIPKHHHPGTQVATILAGTLSYHVYAGTVPVYRQVAGAPVLAFRIRPGHTGTLRAGDTLIEQPSDVHQAENHGTKAVRVIIATLFPAGAPPSIPVK